MASAPKKVNKTTVSTPVKGGGTKTVTKTVTQQGGNTTTSTRTTISGPKKASKPKKAATKKAAAKAKKPAKLARPPLGGNWITGPNEKYPLCGAVAIANHLLAATGVEASSGTIERLYRAAGGHGDSGAPMPALLAAAATEGLAGCRLAAWAWADPDEADLLLLTLPGITDLHAAAISGGDVITWGKAVPLSALGATVEAAWSLTWHGTEVTCG